MNTPAISRRFALKGLGATLALPWMESLAHAVGAPTPRTIAQPPVRFAFLMMSNGVAPKDWWAKMTAGGGIEFSRTLAPLTPLQKDVLVLENMNLFPGLKTAAGHKHFTNFLSGAEVGEAETYTAAETIDQLLGRTIGQATAIPSLTLGVEPIVPRAGTSGIKVFTVSWRNATTPIPPEAYPRQAFDRLFNVKAMLEDKSVLDVVLQQAKTLERKLGLRDRAQLDRYLTSVREVEVRIEKAGRNSRPAGAWQPTLAEPNIPEPAPGLGLPINERIKLMQDILLLAFQTDRTRVATLVYASDVSSAMTYQFLEGVGGGSLHGISHHQNRPEAMAQYQKINQFHVEQFAYLLQRMKDIDEGGSTLLDNSMVAFGSNMFDGNIHDYSHVPLLLGGRGGGTIETGRVVRFENDNERLVCNLWLSLARRMGAKLDNFGNSVAPLKNLGTFA